MKINRKLLITTAMFILVTVSLTGCFGKTAQTSSESVQDSSGSTPQTGVTDVSTTPVTVKFDSEDYSFDWSSQSRKKIDMTQGSQSITSSGIYEITGNASDASLNVKVDKDKDDNTVFLVLNGVSITSSSTAPIYIEQAKKVVILLAENTVNKISQGSAVKVNEESEPSAAIFSKSNLTITGKGSLEVSTDYNDAITSKDKLKITDGNIKVTAKNDGIIGKDLLAVENAVITINAGKDGMRSTNTADADKGNVVIKGGTFTINAANDAVQAEKNLEINGGIFTINGGGGFSGVIKSDTMGGGMGGGRSPWGNNEGNQKTTSNEESKKGLKGAQSILITGGTFTLNAYDDAIHSNGNVVITGGTFTIQAGAKGIHADATVTLKDSDINILNCFEGLEGSNINVNSGKLTVKAKDDTFNINNSKGVLTINNGDLNLNGDGDGIDSNGAIVMNGGSVYVDGPTSNNNGSLDFETTFTINGGTLVASGSSGMAQVPQNGSQLSVLMYFTTAQASGTKISLKDESGNVLASFTPTKQYTSVAISSPSIKNGGKYTVFTNDTQVVSFTVTQNTTYLDENGVTTSKGGFPGGGPGGNQGGNPGDRPGNVPNGNPGDFPGRR